LAPEINNPDVRIIKTILAIRNNPQRNNINFHIVAEIKERINLEVAMIAGFYTLKYFCETRNERSVELYRVKICTPADVRDTLVIRPHPQIGLSITDARDVQSKLFFYPIPCLGEIILP
jgi:hypothetical protein